VQAVLAQNILRTLQKQAGVLEYSLKKLEVLQSGYWSQSTAKELVFKAGKRPFEVPVYESKVLVRVLASDAPASDRARYEVGWRPGAAGVAAVF
jgi:hypothetical protein